MNKLSYGEYISPFPTRVPLSDKQYVHLHKPTINEIMAIGFDTFDIFMTYLKMTPKFYYTILCAGIGGIEYWDSLNEVQDTIKLFNVVLADSAIRDVLVDVLNFFYEETVVFNNSRFYFINKECDGSKELQPEDILAVISDSDKFERALYWCQMICGIASQDKEEEPPKFKNKTAEVMWKRIQESIKKQEELEAKKNKLKYSLPNIVSAICAYHPSINFSNVGQLTLPQVRDSLVRILQIDEYTIVRNSVSVWGTKDDKEFAIDQWLSNRYDE